MGLWFKAALRVALRWIAVLAVALAVGVGGASLVVLFTWIAVRFPFVALAALGSLAVGAFALFASVFADDVRTERRRLEDARERERGCW